MRKKRLLAYALAAFTIFSSITAYADPGAAQAAATESTAENEQYPLSHLADWFVVDKSGCLTTKWDFDYLWVDMGMEHGSVQNYRIDNAIKDKNANYLSPPSWYDMFVIAKLAGVPLAGYEDMVNNPDVLKLEKEVRDFLDSFDWKNASELEKASRVAKRIIRANYDENASTSNDCLVNGKASCAGYSNAANLLGFCIGLQVGNNGRISINHAYPSFLVKGVWLSYEPTRKDNHFYIDDYKNNIETFQDGTTFNGLFAEYCIRSGYQIPEDITGMFPNVGVTHYEDTVTGEKWMTQVVPLQ